MKKIQFSHKRYGDVAVVTACYLHIITGAEEYTLKYGGYYESPVETFDKQKSRKAALTDAIRDIRRDIRADVWEVYFEQFPDRKSKVAKKIALLEKTLAFKMKQVSELTDRLNRYEFKITQERWDIMTKADKTGH